MHFDDLDPRVLRRRAGKKWAACDADVLPAWVADMDFMPAAPIRDALTNAVASGDLGYGPMPGADRLREVFTARCARRYGWDVASDQVEVICDVVQGLYLALQAFTRAGEGAVVMTPIYPPFLQAVAETGRRLVAQPLRHDGACYRMDIAALEAGLDADTRLVMLCSPHNPSGRAWQRQELEALAEVVLRHDLVVVSDEIHADLMFDDRPHVPFASLSAEVAARTVTLMSASKAFNIAGLRCAVMVAGNKALHARLLSIPRHLRGAVSTLGALATRVAWEQCDDWLLAVRDYLRENRDHVTRFLRDQCPEVGFVPPEATYLAWLDCRALDLPAPPARYLLEHARVRLSEGTDFGAPGAGHVRLNFATSRAIVEQILARIGHALSSDKRSVRRLD